MKRRKGFLAILLCFMLIFLVGCPSGGPSGNDDLDDDEDGNGGDSQQIISMDGVKVLSKPSDYDINDALAGYSENFYNLFAREILLNLYDIYELQKTDNNIEIYERLIDDIETDKGTTFNKDTDEIHLYDTLRYTIDSVTTYEGTDSENKTTKYQEIKLDLDSAWNWVSHGNVANELTFFENIENFLNVSQNPNDYIFVSSNKKNVTIKDAYITSNGNWEKLFEQYGKEGTYGKLLPNFSKYYAASEDDKLEHDYIASVGDVRKIIDYYLSPYYQTINNQTVTAFNYYQDVLEYVTYLFVLGYDMETEADKPYFDFTYNKVGGVVQDIMVKGWESTPISISKGNNSALSRVKETYENVGNYIGVKEKNKTQIANFIKKEVIGEKAYAKNTFEVTKDKITLTAGVNSVPVTESTVKYNRNYDKIIENIIDYACEQAPIGYDASYVDPDTGDKGRRLSLDEAYLMSSVTDYVGDYFGAFYDEEDDSDLFRYVSAAEYQNIVIYPTEEQLGTKLGDVYLALEYDGPAVEGKRFADSITINVGLRYFDHKTGTYKGEVMAQKVIPHRAFPDSDNYADEEEFIADFESQLVTFSDSSGDDNFDDKYGFNEIDADEIDGFFGDITLAESFNNNIGGGVINPFVSGTILDPLIPKVATMTLNGKSKAREYYKLNESSSYGFFGSLDGNAFMGDDGCDFLEIYFDIVKEKGKPDINYNFKVVIYNFMEASDDVDLDI